MHLHCMAYQKHTKKTAPLDQLLPTCNPHITIKQNSQQRHCNICIFNECYYLQTFGIVIESPLPTPIVNLVMEHYYYKLPYYQIHFLQKICRRYYHMENNLKINSTNTTKSLILLLKKVIIKLSISQILLCHTTKPKKRSAN